MTCTFTINKPLLIKELNKRCQFESTDFSEVDPKATNLCLFHSSLDQALPTVGAKRHWGKEEQESFKEKVTEYISACLLENVTINPNGVVFPSGTDFSEIFSQLGVKEVPDISCVDTRFYGYASFANLIFSETADFQDAVFSETASFEDCEFRNNAQFSKSVFQSMAAFQNTRFEKPVSFEDAAFPHIADFESAVFQRPVGFSTSYSESKREDAGGRAKFHHARFDRATFRAHATFAGRQFTGTVTFKGTIFEAAPTFQSCKFGQSLHILSAQFRDCSSSLAAANYRALKLSMEQLRAGDEESLFYSLEMKARRHQDGIPFSIKVFSWLYETTALYGQSLSLPLVWLLIVYLIFFFVSAIGLEADACDPRALADVARFGLAQITRPFNAIALTEPVRIGNADHHVPLWLACLSAIQSIASLGLVALFLIALRRRFRAN